jgi:hypothetical protein
VEEEEEEEEERVPEKRMNGWRRVRLLLFLQCTCTQRPTRRNAAHVWLIVSASIGRKGQRERHENLVSTHPPRARTSRHHQSLQ